MTYYSDGSPYEYDEPSEGMVNVGWLDGSHEYSEGDVPDDVVDGLLRLAINPVNLTRGFHTCDLCNRFYLKVQNPHSASGTTLLGTAEIHVRGDANTVFAAPDLVIHYILDHGYSPPLPFQTAVLALYAPNV
ncbi:hypothetical protein ACFWOG_20770 [Kitasatospora sp. NPDC058406]|uniref:DUF7919 family protein n=1 Tax=Streptomycetaceae TaxID=2062 RepID=UPI002E776665|nr:hypothetical protein [Streptomyces sp. BE303]MED7952102.1 hypothetical protein [Streptomyces sp. BE303]